MIVMGTCCFRMCKVKYALKLCVKCKCFEPYDNKLCYICYDKKYKITKNIIYNI